MDLNLIATKSNQQLFKQIVQLTCSYYFKQLFWTTILSHYVKFFGI